MPRFNLDDYEPVEDRIRKFWGDHPTGRIITELITDSTDRFVVRAHVFRDHIDPQPAASGFAEEVVSDRGVNATSALENCETSAIGRALANAGYATKGKRPSREEMAKVQRRTTPADAGLSNEDQANLAAAMAAFEAVDSQEALRAAWAEYGEWLDVDVDGRTLRQVILARNAAIKKAAAA